MSGLDQQQLDKLQQFMELADIHDSDFATAMLASLDWDVEKAFDEHQNQKGFADDVPNFLDHLNEDSQRNTPSSGYSSRPSGSNVTLASNGVDSGSGSSSSLMLGTQLSSTMYEYDTDGDHEDQDEPDYYEYELDNDDDEGEVISVVRSGLPRVTDSRPPLIPPNWASADEATVEFSMAFETRYGGIHPFFYVGTLESAAKEAFEHSDISDRRPLAIYLHDDKAVACNIFASTVLCDSEISALLNGQFITWPWDVTQGDNKEQVRSWMRNLGMYDCAEHVRDVPVDHYPLLMVVTASKKEYTAAGFSTGHESPKNITENLIDALSKYQDIKDGEIKMLKEREERALIRQEQQDEYEKALAADRARVEEEEQIRLLQKMQEEEERRKVADMEARCAKLRDTIPEEPLATDSDIVTVRIRLPCGEPVMRRFRRSEPVRCLIDFVQSEGFFTEDYIVWDSNRPRKNVFEFDSELSFADLRFPLREQVIVEEK